MRKGQKLQACLLHYACMSCVMHCSPWMAHVQAKRTFPRPHRSFMHTIHVTLLFGKYSQTIHCFLLLLKYAHLGGVAAACRGWKLCADRLFNFYYTAFLVRDKHPMQAGIYFLGLCCIRSCLCLNTHYHCFLLIFKSKCSSVSSPSPNPFVSPLQTHGRTPGRALLSKIRSKSCR